ncbi:MAG TPA: AraC family transcriptional regulator [Blastocatellia bacterium]|nr:AraC family transcriptional regulator [Blastocatellia bacterium]
MGQAWEPKGNVAWTRRAERLPPGHLYGESLKTRRLPGAILSERKYPPGFRTPTHSHEQDLFCLVIRGGYTEMVGTTTRVCEPSLLLFHPADEVHAEHFHQTGGSSFILEIEPWWLKQIRQHTRVIDSSACFRGGHPVVLGMRLYREFLEGEDELSPLVMEGLVLALIGEASRSAVTPTVGHPPKWLVEAKELLHERFREPLTLAEIAHAVGVHPVHLAQMFHKYYKCTIGGYIRQLRLEFACHQLITTPAPLCQIALASGFSDQSHFTRTFKRYLGVPPGQYRELFSKPKMVQHRFNPFKTTG